MRLPGNSSIIAALLKSQSTGAKYVNWVVFGLISAMLMASGDFFLKIASGEVSSSVGVLLYGTCTFLTGLIWTLAQKSQGAPLFARPVGVAAGLATGVSFGLATVALYCAYSRGAPISIGSPLTRLGSLLLASLLGLTLLREPLTWRWGIGMAFAVTGVYLIVTR
jgi:bacterial/archaeal transporter family protein